MWVSGRVSAGLLLFRRPARSLELLVAHPGGPFYGRKNEGVWTIPKGLVEPNEAPLDAARREFAEETGFTVPAGPFHDLGEARLKSGKRVLVYAVEGDADPTALVSNRFAMEWPPRSGRRATFPEIDRAQFVAPADARSLLHPAQRVFVGRLLAVLESSH